MKTAQISLKIIAAFCLLLPLSAVAEGVVFATEEDLAAFDQLVVKSQNSGTAKANEKTSANFQRVREKLNSLIENEKAKGATEAKGKGPIFGDGSAPGNSQGAAASGSARGQGKFPDGSPGKGKGKGRD
ncbi:MAG: hypothetical protein IT288_15385 [Bdellovibrionales bacterium]|nr:hypothetical protein [Bdellovibrionales bacterium]